jgi:hypothetical protein
MSISHARHFFDLSSKGCIAVPESDVLSYGCGEQEGLLKDNTYLTTQVYPTMMSLAIIVTVDHDSTPYHVIEARDETDQSGFACSSGTDDPHHHARLYRQVDVLGEPECDPSYENETFSNCT